MPSPIVPSDWKALINSLTGGMCERMSKLFQTVNLKAQEHSYKYNEEGLPTDEYKSDLCEALADCLGDGGGGEPPNPSMAAPEALTASDDAYSDKIVIDWSPVTGATQYKLYRSASSNFSGAALIATITHPTVEYEDPVDGDLSAGTNYWYWARATDGTNVSALSNRDQGRAASGGEIGVLDAISDLRTTYGFGGIISAIALDWTPPAGSTKFDIYRGTTNVFASATKIYSDVIPNEIELAHPTSNPECWDNGERITLYDTPPSSAQDYYYFVVAKKDSPPAVSDESNASLGRVQPPSIYNQGQEVLAYGSLSYEVPVGQSKAWVVLLGSGGGGAGGGGVYGGGGGGGGGIVQFTLTGLSPGDILEINAVSGVNTGNAPTETDGTDGEDIELSLNATPIAQANKGAGGQYNPAGGGLGGSGGTASADVGSPVIYNGTDGLPGSGSNGGQSGYLFGGRRLPQADGTTLGGYNGDGFVGSGAKAVPFNPLLSVGGYGLTGKAYITFGT